MPLKAKTALGPERYAEENPPPLAEACVSRSQVLMTAFEDCSMVSAVRTVQLNATRGFPAMSVIPDVSDSVYVWPGIRSAVGTNVAVVVAVELDGVTVPGSPSMSRR